MTKFKFEENLHLQKFDKLQHILLQYSAFFKMSKTAIILYDRQVTNLRSDPSNEQLLNKVYGVRMLDL